MPERAFISTDLEISSLCRGTCAMCPRMRLGRPQMLMAKDVFYRVVEKIAAPGRAISFSGMGDPLAHPELSRFITRARTLGAKTVVVLNPALLTDEAVDRLAESPPDRVTFSFPSLRPEVFSMLMPGVCMVDALAAVTGLRARLPASVGAVVAGLSTVRNADEQGEFVAYWRALGIRAEMRRCHGRGGNLTETLFYVPVATRRPPPVACGLFGFHTFVTSGADVLACCHDLDGRTRIGNLETDSVAEIAARKAAMADGLRFDICAICDEPFRTLDTTGLKTPETRRQLDRFFSSLAGRIT